VRQLKTGERKKTAPGRARGFRADEMGGEKVVWAETDGKERPDYKTTAQLSLEVWKTLNHRVR